VCKELILIYYFHYSASHIHSKGGSLVGLVIYWNCILEHGFEGNVNGKIGGAKRRGRRSYGKEKMEKTLDRPIWRNRG
jgi:hypothetical protein